jgi:hypothetical protein
MGLLELKAGKLYELYEGGQFTAVVMFISQPVGYLYRVLLPSGQIADCFSTFAELKEIKQY